jgi:signal transduction histidine kinase
MNRPHDAAATTDDGSVHAVADLFNDPRVRQLTALGATLWYRAELSSGRVTWTAPLLAHWGYELDDMPAHIDWWLERTHPDDVGLLAAFLDQAPAGARERWELSYRFRKANGDWVRVEGRAMLVRAPDGRPIATQGSVVDVTRPDEVIGRQFATIGRMAGGVAHDFNNILTVARMNADLLHLDGSGESRLVFSDLTDALDRASALVQRLLALVRAEHWAPSRLDVGSVVHNFARIGTRLVGREIGYASFAEGEAMVMADAAQLEQVLLNLVVNARDAITGTGRVSVTASRLSLAVPLVHLHGVVPVGAWVRLRVSDSGSGIPPTILPLIFRPLFTTKPGRGTGLGLATVLSIMEGWQGHVVVDSVVGEGTSVSCYLPAAG